MAEPIVQSFVIDTTQAEQNLKKLDVASIATKGALDALYTELIRLDEQLQQLAPNTDGFKAVNVEIAKLEQAITSIESSKIEAIGTAISSIDVGNAVSEIESVSTAISDINPDAAVSSIGEIEQAINQIDTSNATDSIGEIDAAINNINPEAAISSIGEIEQAINEIDTTNAIDSIGEINAAINNINPDVAINAVVEIDTTLSSISADETTAAIDEINNAIGSIDSSTAVASINEVNQAINEVDASGISSEIASIETALESIDTTQVVSNIESINDAASAIDISNVATDIDSINSSLGSIDTTQAVTSISKIETSLNAIDATNAIGNIENIDTALEGIDTANVVTDIDNINSALSSIDASSAVAQVDSVNSALDAVDTSNVTGQIESINSELASVDVSTAINEIAAINEEFSKIDTTNVISEILGIGDSVNQIDTSGVVDQIAAINTELNSIDATNVTADISEISTAIEGIDASGAVTEITSIDSALSGIDTDAVVSEIENIGEAVSSINTDSIEQVGAAVDSVTTPVNNLTTATDALNNELKDTKLDTASIDSATSNFQELQVEEEAVTNSTKSLKAQLRELQKQLADIDPQTDKYRELSQAAGELKDKIQDAAQAVGSQAGGAFERVGGSLGLVTSRIANLDFEGAAEGAKLLAQNIGSIKPGDIANGIKGIGSAFASIGKALLTNPIFLIGAAIAAAIVYSEELLSLVDGVSSAEQERLAAQQESAKASKEQLDSITAQENTLRLAGKSEKEILQFKIAAAKQAIIDQKAVIATLEIQRQQQIDAAKRNADITKGILNFLTAPLQLLIGAVDYIILGLNKVGVISDETFASIGSLRESFNESVTGLLFDPTEVAAEGQKSIDEAKKTLQGLENTQAGFQLSLNGINKKGADERNAANEKARQDDLKNSQAYYDELAKQQDDAYVAGLTDKEKEQQAVIEKYEKLFALADAAGQSTVNLQKQLANELLVIEQSLTDEQIKELERRRVATANYYQQLTALQDAQYVETLSASEKEELAVTQKYEALFAAADAAGISTTDLQKQLAAELLAIQQKSAADGVQITQDNSQKEIENAQTVKDAKLQLASEALGSIANLANAFAKGDEKRAKNAFKIQKAVSIAQATVDTYKGANAAFYSTQANPISILFPAAPYIAAGAAVAAGLANVATISQQQFQGGGSTPNTESTPASIGGGDGGGGAQPAQFNPLAAQFLNNRPEQLTPRAYVLAGDVASQQEVRSKVEDLSRIG